MINKAKETEEIYKQKFSKIQEIKVFDVEIERQDLEDHFRNVNLVFESVQELKKKS